MDLQLKDKTYLIINGQEIIIPRDRHWCPVSLLFGVKEDGSFYPIKITADGELVVAADLQVPNIQIGAVAIKDDTNDVRLNITQEGLASAGLKGIVIFGKDTDGKVKTFLFDSQGQLVVSSPYLNDIITAINQKLDVNLSTRASEQTLSQIKQNTDRIPTNPATEDGNLASIKTNTDNLDVNLSTRASEQTLSQIKQNTDRIPTNPATEDGNLASIKTNTDNLDVSLSTRASEQTLSQILSKVLPLSFDDNQKLLTNVTDSVISIKDYITDLKLNVISNNQDLSGITGILIFGKDGQNKSRTLLFDNNGNLVISSDQLNNIINILTSKLDVTLSTRASESTLSSIKTDTDNLDVLLSSRFSEQTGLQILTKLLPLTFDDQNKLLVSVDIGTVEIKDGNVKLNLIGEGSSVLNLNGILVFGKDNQNNARLLLFDNQNRLIVSDPTVVDLLNFLTQKLDVNLSTRASEQTLSQIKQNTDRIPTNPATEDGNLASIKTNTDNLDVNLSTRASEQTLSQIKQNTDRIPTNPATEDGNLASIKTNTDKLDVSLSTRASEQTLSQIKQNTDRIPTNPATEDGNLASIKTNTDKLDVSLSTRLAPTHLNIDAEKDLQVDVKSLPPVVQQSTRRVLQYPEGTDIDPRQIRALTPSDGITAYGSQDQKLLQRATTYDLIVQLRNNGTEIDPRDIRTLTSADTVTIANQIARDTDSHGQVDVLTYPGPSSGQLPSTLTAGGNLKTAILESLPAGTNLIGGVNLSQLGGTALSGANVVDTTNAALRVNVVAGGAGGGAAQIQVRDSTNVWKDVGYYTGNLNMPVEIKTALPAGNNNIGDVDVLTYPGPSSSQLPTTLTANGNLKTAIQEAVTLTVQATNLDIRGLVKTRDEVYSVLRTDTGVSYDARQIRPLTSSDVVSAVQSGVWNINNLLNPHPVKIGENILGFQFLATEPTPLTTDTANLYARVDAYKRLLVNVVNFPTDYAKQSQLPSALTASGNLKTAVSEALPAGTNTIGNVNAIKSGTWNIDNLLNPHPVLVNRQGAITHFSVVLTAAGTSTIYTPSTGKAAKVIAWSFYSDADVIVEMRFGTSGKTIAGLPTKGVHAMNLIGTEAPTGAANEAIVIYGSEAVNVKGWISVTEV